MVASCFALGCTVRNVPGCPYTFHRIPRDRSRAMQWLRALGRENTRFGSLKHRKVCSMHFDPKCFVGRNERGVSLAPDAVPTLFLPQSDLAGTSSTMPQENETKETPMLRFGEFTEERIRKSPLDALRAFRLAKTIIQHKETRIRKLVRTKRSHQAKIRRYSTRILEIPDRWRNIIGLDPSEGNDVCAQIMDALLTDPESEEEEESDDAKDSTKEKEKDSDKDDSDKTASVKIKEEPVSDEDDSESSGLMDQDEWSNTLPYTSPPAPSEETILGIPLQIEGLEGTSAQMSVPTVQPVPMALLSDVRPVLPLRMPSTNVLGDCPYEFLGFKKARSVQTDIMGSLTCVCYPYCYPKMRTKCNQTEIASPSSDSETEPPANEDPESFDRFGAFVTKKLKALPRKKAILLQTTYSALFKADNG